GWAVLCLVGPKPAKVLRVDALWLLTREVLGIDDGAANLDRLGLPLAEQIRIVSVEAVTDPAHIAARTPGDMAIARVFASSHARVFLVELIARLARGSQCPVPLEPLLDRVESTAEQRQLHRESPQRRPQRAERKPRAESEGGRQRGLAHPLRGKISPRPAGEVVFVQIVRDLRKVVNR